MWCIDQFYILLWILLESGTAYCLSWRYLHWLDIEISYCVFDTEKFILSKWWEHTAGNSWRRVWLSWNVWWRGYTLLWVLDIEMHWHCEDNDQICSSYLSESLCDEMFRSCEDNTYIIIIIVIYRSYLWSWTMPFIASKSVVVLRRLWSSRKDNMRFCLTVWISYYSGRKTTAIQLYLADLHWQCRTEHFILHWGLKLWDTISMWKADLEMERCVLTMFCIQKKVVQIPCVNHFVLEKLTGNVS